MRIRTLFALLTIAALLSGCGSTPSWKGYSPVEAQALQTMGLSASEADKYRDMAFTSDTIQSWYDAGFSTRESITAWHDAGFTAESAGKWHQAKFDLKAANDWRDENFTAEEAQSWQEKGYGLRDAKKQRK